MKWTIPVRWDMYSVISVDSPTLYDAYEHALEIAAGQAGDPLSYVEEACSEMLDGSFEIDYDGNSIERLRTEYNSGRPDLNVEDYPELNEYDENLHRDIKSDDYGLCIGAVRINFVVDGTLFECDVWFPSNPDTKIALGEFFSKHPNITYKMVQSFETVW